MEDPAGLFIVNVALLFGGAAAVLWVLRWLAFRLLPPALVGPGGFLIDTTRSRLGLLQMRPRYGRHGSFGGGGAGGGGGGGDGC